MIYLDSASFCPTLPVAKEAYLNAPFGNPSSEHAVGQRARAALEGARKKITRLLDCGISEVYFTSTASETAAWVCNSLRYFGWEVAPSEIEHHAILENYDKFHKDIRHVAYARMLGQNETGEIISKPLIVSDNLWICDATASVGHTPISFRELGADYFLCDALKFGGVPGAALLIAKKEAPLVPLIRGGGQERGMRSGTESLPAICAMASALEWQVEHTEENTRKLSKLRDIFISAFAKIDNVLINTPLEKPNLPHILNVSFMGVDNHALTLLLSQKGVMVSPGAACSNGLNEPSHVLMAMFHDEQRARSAIRISLSHENTYSECVEAAKTIRESVEYLRGIV